MDYAAQCLGQRRQVIGFDRQPGSLRQAGQPGRRCDKRDPAADRFGGGCRIALPPGQENGQAGAVIQRIQHRPFRITNDPHPPFQFRRGGAGVQGLFVGQVAPAVPGDGKRPVQICKRRQGVKQQGVTLARRQHPSG